jgi:hypothetical protein
MIHENAFGYANPKTFKDRTRKIKYIQINGSGLSVLSRNLLPWDKLDNIEMLNNDLLSCNPEVSF